MHKARTREVGTTESVRDLSGDDLSSKDKELSLLESYYFYTILLFICWYFSVLFTPLDIYTFLHFKRRFL